MITGYTDQLPPDCLLDAGVLFVGATPIGASTGGLKFDPKKTTRQIQFDGMRAPIAGNDRTTKFASVITGKFLQLGAAQAVKLEPDLASASAGSVITYTPKAAGILYTPGAYLTDVRLVLERGGSTVSAPKYAAVYFKKSLCSKYSLVSKDEAEAEIDSEFEARLDVLGGAEINDAPYVIELRTSLPS